MRHATRKKHGGLFQLLVMLLLVPRGDALAQRSELSAVIDTTVVPLGRARMPSRTPPSARGWLHDALRWRAVRPGIARATLDLRVGTLGAPVTAVVVRVNPAMYRFALEWRTEANGMTGTWTLDSAPADAALAMNAGQFRETGPWGWVALHGVEERAPARAPLAAAVRVDAVGRLHWDADGPATFAFQSFPLLVRDHVVPARLRDASYVDMDHRDARLVMAERDDGALLFVLTRFGAMGALGERVPIGLTTPETLSLVTALGVRHALMLDGGVSAQMLLRDSSGAATYWPGLRRVPLALYAMPRAQH